MKICYIANSASFHTEKWVKHFLGLGHEVHVITHENVNIEGAKIHFVDYSLRNFFSRASKVHRLIREINPDVLHAHQANTCGLYAASMSGYKKVVSAWGSDILVSPEKSRIMRLIVKYVIKHADYMTSDSHYMSEKIVKLGGRAEKIYTFPMGVESFLTNYKHEFTENNFINIISNRRLEEIYNIDIVIKGFAKALEELPNMRLTVAADGSKMQELIELSKELKIEEKIVFTGRYKAEDIGKMLEENAIFISIPESDSTSVSLLEAMCCGLFPIVSNLPANLEWVRDKENGIVIKESSDDELSRAIVWCANNFDILKKASEENAKLIREKALWDNNVKIVEGIYEDIVHKK